MAIAIWIVEYWIVVLVAFLVIKAVDALFGWNSFRDSPSKRD